MDDEKQRDLHTNNKKAVITTANENSHVPSAQTKLSVNNSVSRSSSVGGKHSTTGSFSLSKSISSFKAAASRTSAKLKTTIAEKNGKPDPLRLFSEIRDQAPFLLPENLRKYAFCGGGVAVSGGGDLSADRKVPRFHAQRLDRKSLAANDQFPVIGVGHDHFVV